MIVFGDVLSENRRKMVTQTPVNAWYRQKDRENEVCSEKWAPSMKNDQHNANYTMTYYVDMYLRQIEALEG
jgi:hypothetical protein